ncbi:hypothetical protein GON01_04805 [Sphingomonas sp. MAH-20]|uniref:DUF6894 domain-containing protein n=1 Tax=Sphingomonas horti TaxID=2682842 RepID=A0A6I4IYH0_9SPHN|nr:MULTISPECIES: hypothetical protein [Sphingomonas]MBA2918292.1 hypothetical protein [Sphingomonas sp. CGMCC 1.13658]MVO77259.1 hypothetical protein [Sphingomonas horti]
MNRFYFHIVDGQFVRDEEGQEFPGLEEAKAEAIAAARSIMREAIWAGRLPLNEGIQITDGNGTVLMTVPFRDAITIEE